MNDAYDFTKLMHSDLKKVKKSPLNNWLKVKKKKRKHLQDLDILSKVKETQLKWKLLDQK